MEAIPRVGLARDPPRDDSHSSAAIMRIGLLEMKHFCQEFFQDVKDETFLEESAGVADVITSCE